MKPTLKEILDATLEESNIPFDYYKSVCKSRLANIVKIRQVVSYIAVRYGYAQYSIADFLKINRTTVNHHKELAEDYYMYEKEFANLVDRVLTRFEDVKVMQYVRGWVTRSKDGETVKFFTSRPIKNGDDWTSYSLSYILPSNYFPQVTYGDSPRSCGMTLRLR